MHPDKTNGSAVATTERVPNDTDPSTSWTSLADSRPVQGRNKANVSLVIPAMNEAKNISWVLLGIPPSVSEVILVNGDSHDETVEIATRIRPDILVVDDPGGGKGAALRAGFDAATGDYIVMMDADGSMNPDEIDRYVSMLDAGHDLVKGSRFMTGGGSTDITWLRNLGNRGLLILLNRLFSVKLSDLCYGYCGFRRDVLPDMHLATDGFEIETEITVQAFNSNLRVCEVPSMETPRGHGESNLNTFSDGFRVLRLLLAGWLTPNRRRRSKAHEPLDLNRELELHAVAGEQ